MPRLSGRVSRSAGLFLLLPLAACAERSPVAPADAPEPAALTKLRCTVQVRAESLTCTQEPSLAAGARGALYLGGQGVYVRLTSSGVSFNAGTGILRADVTVQNLLGQPLGTTDGTTADSAGLKVFFHTGPTRTVGSGSVEVANEHGTATFTESLQPFFKYPGMLATEQVSTAQEWRFLLTGTVATFVFSVYVAAAVPDQDALGTIDLDRRPLAVGGYHSCALTIEGTAYCWGANEDGQMGSPVQDSMPIGVDSVFTWRHLTAGRYHTCGVRTDDKAYCWGDDETGQLGAEGEEDRFAPVPVSGGHSWRMLDAGAGHTCGITTAHALYCWGNGDAGQLGVGDSVSRGVPVEVFGGRAWASVDAGTDHTCAVTRGGAAFCWGDNSAGELGRAGASTARPVLVTGNHSWRWVSAGENFTCGITSLNAAMCWGSDSAGQVGNGPAPSGSTPSAVLGGYNWSRINAGRETACGVSTTGEPYCWGYNNTGEIGDGSNTASDAPVSLVAGLSSAWIDNGDYHTCGIDTNGTARCWGYNKQGQLGSSNTEDRWFPEQVTRRHTWGQ